MSGNVKEWCYDYFWLYQKTFGKTIDNPVGPSTGYARVVRGGGFRSKNYTCRVYNRDCSFPDVKKDDIGFRLVLEVEN
jgi:formylglycine-generating enzyme required for sulfatase activity